MLPCLGQHTRANSANTGSSQLGALAHDRVRKGKGGSVKRDLNRDQALRLAEHGISVFPCDSATRKPMVLWRECSSVDPVTIAGWWHDNPGSLPGIDLHKIGAIVLDGDRHHKDVDGRASLRQLLIQHRISLEGVPTTITPRDGVHLYFKNTAELGNKRGALPNGIDVKGRGGLVIAPETVLPDGRTYQPLPKQPSLLTTVQARMLPPLPQPIIEIIRRQPERPPTEIKFPSTSPVANDRCALAWANSALENECAQLAAMLPSTGRNNALNGAAYALGRKTRWLRPADIAARLREAARANGLLAEDGQRSVDATIRSGLTAGMRNPHPGPRR
jgi:hypothetical protein